MSNDIVYRPPRQGMTFAVFDFYAKATSPVTSPVEKPLRVWAKKPGEKAALFECDGRSSIEAAIRAAREDGYARAMVEVK